MLGEIVDNSRIVSGYDVFKIMDTKGLPLDVINETLRANDCGFNVVQFIEAALASRNFTYQTIKQRLLSAHIGDRENMSQLLDGVAKSKGWLN